MYITYEQYTDFGGSLDETAFNMWARRAARKLDYFTLGRLKRVPIQEPEDPAVEPDEPVEEPEVEEPENNEEVEALSEDDTEEPEEPADEPVEEPEEPSEEPEPDEPVEPEKPKNPLLEAYGDVVAECMFEFIERMSSCINDNGELKSYSNGIESFTFNSGKDVDEDLYNLAVEYLPLEIISADIAI